MAVTRLEAGFVDPVMEAHSVFRAVLAAFANPGRSRSVAARLSPPRPLYAGTAALMLALADYETNIWLDPSADNGAVRDYLQFHTGCRISADRGCANFAVIVGPQRMPTLADFAQGSAEYPDRSTTVVVQVQTFHSHSWLLAGPGIETRQPFSAEPLPTDFVEQLASNRAGFPCGVDVVLVAGSEIVALPRSTRVSREG